MDLLTKQKTYVWLIILLVAINLTTLVLLWVGRPGPPPLNKHNKPDTDKFLKNELSLSNEQESKLKQLRQELFDSTAGLNNTIRMMKKQLQEEAFKINPDITKVDSLLKNIGKMQSKNEQFMFNHFGQLRKVLSEEQQIKFKRIISEAGKNGQRPERRDGQHPPPPINEFPPEEH